MNILSSNTTPLFLPKDIIFDMLSYLPVKSVQRFKCVSQLWNIITQDFRFICLHFKHVRPLINYNKKKSEENITTTDEYKLIFSRGLILEYATRPSHFPCSPNLRYRVRNPELHDQIVEIPDSEKPILNMQMVVDPNNQVLKLLSLVYDELLEDQVLDQVLSYEVLDLQSEGSNYSWRPINLPQHSRGKTRMCKLVKKHTGQIKVVFTNLGIVYSIWDAEEYSHIGIDILDMVNESYIGHTTLPTCFYTKDDCKLWNGKLSFAKIVKDEVHVLILESYNKKHMKWADGKLIIKLPFLKDVSVEPVIKLLYLSNTNKLFFVWRDKESIHSFDIKTGKLTIILSNYKLSQGLYLSWPGLFTFKGLQSSSGQ